MANITYDMMWQESMAEYTRLRASLKDMQSAEVDKFMKNFDDVQNEKVIPRASSLMWHPLCLMFNPLCLISHVASLVPHPS